MDNQAIVASYEEDVRKTMQMYPALQEIGERSIVAMKNYSNETGVFKQKQKYFVIGQDLYSREIDTENELSDEERLAIATNELRGKVETTLSQLTGIGFTQVKLLAGGELYGLWGSIFHRDNQSYQQFPLNFSSLFTFGEDNEVRKGDPKAVADLAIFKAQKTIKDEIYSNKNVSNEEKLSYVDLISKLKDIRNDISSK